jgi:myosin-light-chain kinase
VAPEVVNFDLIGYGTDMWSVGIIGYVLWVTKLPFRTFKFAFSCWF